MPRVFLVDDQAAVLKASARLLASADFSVDCFTCAQAFLDSGHADAPGCLVSDLCMPGMHGLALQQALTERGSLLPVIFLTGQGDIDAGVRAMKSGAVDFLTKPAHGERLIDAVRTAIDRNGQARLERARSRELQARLASLTPREREVLMLVVAGKLNKQVADVLGTAEKTVKIQRARVMSKMKAQSLADLVRLAARLDLAP